MSGSGWVLFLAGVAGAVIFSWWVYYRREFPVPKRLLLAAFRATALVLLLALLANPGLPGPAVTGGAGPWVLLDASASMSANGGQGSPWERALGGLRSDGGADTPLVLFGAEVRRVPSDSLPLLPPLHPESRLAPAVRLAAELGAPGVTILTDGRIGDRGAVEEVVSTSGLAVEWVDVGEDLSHAGILEAQLPRSLAAGDSAVLDVTVFGEGLDSMRVVGILEGGDSVEASIQAPAVGRATAATLPLALPPDSGAYLLRVRVEPGPRGETGPDPYPQDDTLTVTVHVGRPRAGVVMVTLRPGWEAQRLLAVVSRSAGLAGRGFSRMGDGRFLTMETDRTPPRVVSRGVVEAALGAAELLILEGVDAGASDWLLDALSRPVPAIFLVRDREEADLAGVAAGQPLPGEWYAAADVPDSPVLGSLVGADWSGLPPLEGPLPLVSASRRPTGGTDGRSTPILTAARAGGGAPAPVVVLNQDRSRRGVVALASGFWRWDARDGTARRTYARLWSGVTGWLLDVDGSGAARANGTGEPDGRGEPGASEDLGLPGGLGEPGEPSARGEMAHPRVDLGGLFGQGELESVARGPGRPLRRFPLPYLLVIALLCAEWIDRRREGLR
jgi:hypothetical protein